MRIREFATLLAGAAVALASWAPTAGATESEAASGETHCVVTVVGQEADGRFLVSEPECAETLDAALASAEGETSLAAAFTLGTHYDGLNYSGSSFSVVGSDCAGGYLNLSSAWINRVSSTINGCYRVTHYDGYNRTGSSQSTLGLGGNLTTLNNDANSIGYFAS